MNRIISQPHERLIRLFWSQKTINFFCHQHETDMTT